MSDTSTMAAGRRTRSLRWAWRDLPPIPRIGFLAQAAFLGLSLPFYAVTGLSIDWSTIFVPAVGATLLFVLWREHWVRPDASLVGDLALALLLTITLTAVASPAQYVGVALKRPLVDPVLASVDEALGIDLPALVQWTGTHRVLTTALKTCYFSLLPQFVVVPVVLALVYKRRDRLWEYFFHFTFCALVTVVSLAVFPAECAFTYYGFTSLIDQSHFVHQFNGLRQGTLTLIRLSDADGLISMPSFHAAAAMFATWAFRGYRAPLAIALVVNGGLIAATFLTGAHYVVDIVASAGLVWLSILCYRRLPKEK